MNEIDDLRYRVAELERHLDDYHNMLESRMQWQAERVVHEVVSLSSIPLIIGALAVSIAFVRWLDIGGIIGSILIVVSVLTSLGIVGIYRQRFEESEKRRLPQPWKYVRKPSWRKNYD